MEKDQLTSDVAEARRINDDLSTTKATLTSERETLMKEKTELTAKVNRASVIKVEDIAVRGLRIKDSGKAVEKAKAKTVDQLEICFLASENKVTDPGVEQFFIRIINPGGETIKLENAGSGIMVNQETKEQIPYTHIKVFSMTMLSQKFASSGPQTKLSSPVIMPKSKCLTKVSWPAPTLSN